MDATDRMAMDAGVAAGLLRVENGIHVLTEDGHKAVDRKIAEHYNLPVGAVGKLSRERREYLVTAMLHSRG